MTRGGAFPWVLAGVLAPMAGIVAASSLWLASQGWWQHPYYTTGLEWTWAWLPAFAERSGALRETAWLAVTGLGGLVAALAIARLAVMQSGRRKLYGEAKWQTLAGAWRAGIRFWIKPRPDWVVLGYKRIGPVKLYAGLSDDSHITLTAPTGSGKGTGFVIPCALNWGGPLICFSVKRDVLDATAAERERMGHKVFVFDITEPNGLTHHWSGMGEIRSNNGDSYDDIQRAFFTLIPQVQSTNPYWNDAARMVATAVGVMLCETPGEQLHIGRILSIIDAHDHETQLRDMIHQARLEGRPFPEGAVSTVLSWLDNKAEQGAAAVRSTIITALSLWHIPRIRAVTSKNDFSLGHIRESKISIFICAQPGDIRRLRPIFSLFFTQLMYMNSRTDFKDLPSKPPIRTLCLMDEMWALGEMKELADALAFLRSFGLRFAVVLQTKDQLTKSFGEEGARNLFNNTKAELVYGHGTQETSKEVSERAGFNTLEERTTSKPKFNPFNMTRYNENVSQKQRALILPQEVASIPSDKVIVQMKGRPPLLLNKIFWFKDAAFRYKAGSPPPMKPINVVVERDKQQVELTE